MNKCSMIAELIKNVATDFMMIKFSWTSSIQTKLWSLIKNNIWVVEIDFDVAIDLLIWSNNEV